MTDDGTSAPAPEEPDGPAVAVPGADARHPGALGRHLLRPVVGQVAGRAMRFGAGFGRSLTVRRALQASSRVQAGDAGHGVVRAPRWWRPTSEPVGPDATGGAASLHLGADQGVAVVPPSLPDRGLRRAARPVQTDPSRLPGGTSVNAVPQTVPMRLPKEVAAAGRMLTSIDRRRRSSGPPPAPDGRGGPSGNASGTGTTPDVARRGTSAGSSEQAVRRAGAGTHGAAGAPTGRPTGGGTPGPTAPSTGSRYVRRRRAATSVARSTRTDGATGRAATAARQDVGRGIAAAAAPGPARVRPGATTGPGAGPGPGPGPDVAGRPGTTSAPMSAAGSSAAAGARADDSREAGAVVAGAEGRATLGRVLAPLTASTTTELGGARPVERGSAPPLRRALGVPVRLRVRGGSGDVVGATLPGGVRLRPRDEEPTATTSTRPTAPAPGRAAASVVRGVPRTAAGSSPVPGGAAPGSVQRQASPAGAPDAQPAVASTATRGATSSAAADVSAGTAAARTGAASPVPATAAVRRAVGNAPEEAAGGATPGDRPAPRSSSLPAAGRSAEVPGTPSATGASPSASAPAGAGPVGIHVAGAAEPAMPGDAGGGTDDVGTAAREADLAPAHRGAAGVSTVRRYSGLPLVTEALPGRRAAHDELGVPAAGAGRSVRPAGLVQRRTGASAASGPAVVPVTGASAGTAASDGRRGAGSVGRPPAPVARQAWTRAHGARHRAEGASEPIAVVGALPGSAAAAGRGLAVRGAGAVPGGGPAGPSRAASLGAVARQASGPMARPRSASVPGLASGFPSGRTSGLVSSLVSGLGPAARAGAGYADVRRAPSAVAPPAWAWGVVGSSSAPDAPTLRRSRTGRAPALGAHHAAGAAPRGPGAAPATYGTVASATGAPLRRTQASGGRKRLLGLHRGATPPVELPDVQGVSAPSVLPPRAVPALPQPGLPGAEAPAAPGFVRTTPTAAADPSAARRGPTIGAARGAVPGVPGTLSALLAAEAAGRFAAPGAVPPVGADPLQAVGRTIEGAVMTQIAPGTRISRSWAGPADGLPGEPTAGSLTPEQLDDLVDRVVERIEDRVVEELERRGRRRMPGVF